MGFSVEIKISKTLVHFLDKLQQHISEWGGRPGLQENEVTFWNSQLFSWGCDHFLIIFLEESFCIVPDFYSPVSVRNTDIKTTVQASQLSHDKLRHRVRAWMPWPACPSLSTCVVPAFQTLVGPFTLGLCWFHLEVPFLFPKCRGSLGKLYS